MHTQRIEVLHVADRDAVIPAVPHHLTVFDLLPTPKVLIDEDLVRDREGLGIHTLGCIAVVKKVGRFQEMVDR